MDKIFEKDRPSFHVKSDDRVETRRFHPGDVRRGKGTASPVIAGHRSFGELFFSKLFEPLLGAKTLITLSFLRQPVGELTINGYPLGLTIGAEGARSVGTFVPGNPQPSEIFYDPIYGDIG